MSYYLKTLLSEQEKRRILGLHQDRRKQEFRGLFSEAIEEKTKSFFEIGGGFGANIHFLVTNFSNIKKILYF